MVQPEWSVRGTGSLITAQKTYVLFNDEAIWSFPPVYAGKVSILKQIKCHLLCGLQNCNASALLRFEKI